MAMVSFEAFHTSQMRRRSREKDQKESHQANIKGHQQERDRHGDASPSRSRSTTKDADASKRWPSRLEVGRSVEMIEVQIGIVGLIYLDLVAFILYYVLFESNSMLGISEKSVQSTFEVDVTARLLSSVLNFTLTVFVLEVGALLYSFGAAFFSHYGYLMDLIIVSSVIYDDLYDLDMFPLRLLGLLRVWRVARVVSSITNRVEEAHDITKTHLVKAEKDINRAHLDVKRLESSCKVEIDLREQVEKMLQEYKDEIDMMKEALHIAAMDVSTNKHSVHEQEKSVLIDPEGDMFYDDVEE